MNIEEDIFKKTKLQIDNLKKYGFIKQDNKYTFKQFFLDNQFQTIIIIDENNKLLGKVYDIENECEYSSIRIEKNHGEFVNKVRKEYKLILKDIKEKCFEQELYITAQSNRINKYILEKYNQQPEFPWDKYKGYGVYKKNSNHKWYAIIMNIDRSKLENKKGETEIINVKIDNTKTQEYLKETGFYEGYHMNKKNWVSIILDDTVTDTIIFKMIDESYELVK